MSDDALGTTPIKLAFARLVVSPREKFDNRRHAHLAQHLQTAFHFPFFGLFGKAGVHRGDRSPRLHGLRRAEGREQARRFDQREKCEQDEEADKNAKHPFLRKVYDRPHVKVDLGR